MPSDILLRTRYRRRFVFFGSSGTEGSDVTNRECEEVARMAKLKKLKALWVLWADGSATGIRQRLLAHVQRKFPRFGRDMAEEAVADAADRTVAYLRSGRKIRNLRPWLYKLAYAAACDRAEELKAAAERSGDVEIWQRASRVTEDELAERERRHSAAREALEHARRLLPELGVGQIRDVMEVFLDAVANDVPDFPPARIAEAVGIKEDAARVLLRRGLARLRAKAEKEGIRFPDELTDPCDESSLNDERDETE